MGGMPFHLEKGPVFATLEAVYNDPQLLPGFLHSLWVGKADALGLLGVLASPMYNDKQNVLSSNATGEKRLTSMRERWFGEQGGNPQPAFGFGALATGYWARYHGDVRQIVAETLMSAGEVALGVDRPDDPVAAGPPTAFGPWPVEFFWKCGQPRFEGWVTWRNHQNGGGQVTVILATPATPDQVLTRPGRGAARSWPGRGRTNGRACGCAATRTTSSG